MTDEYRGTYCAWCGKPGGFMWTQLLVSKRVDNMFVTIGGTVHWPCLKPWIVWACEKQDLKPPGGENGEESNEPQSG